MSEAQFGDRLKRLRSILGATQEEMARHLGVDVQTIKAWEGGKNEPSLKLARRIAAAYGTTVDGLFSETERVAA